MLLDRSEEPFFLYPGWTRIYEQFGEQLGARSR